MSNAIVSNKRLAKNTMLLYFRMLLMTLVGLYTSRLVLSTLGIENFGIYNVVGGLVSAFSLITTSLSGAISRFITYELGKGNILQLKSIVSVSFNIQILLSIIVVIIAETLGVWFLNNEINIEKERMFAANWVFQCTIIMFIIRLIMVPLHAMVIAHEKMIFFAYTSIFEVILQLAIVFCLLLIPFDELIVYGCLMTLTVVVVFITYLIYCKRNFRESVYRFKFEKNLARDIAGFAGWNFFGTTAMFFRNQGIDIIVNIFFGVLLNAARGVATQVSSAANKFVDSFTTALRPQIIKSYAEGNFERTKFLLNQGTRISVYLVLFYTIPMILEMKAFLSVWLKEVPVWATQFCQLQLFVSLITAFSSIIIMVLLADRNIRKYQMTVGSISLCAFPLAYVMLLVGLPAYTTYIALALIEFVCFFIRLYFTRKLLSISIRYFIVYILRKIVVVGIVATIIPFVIVLTIEPSFARLCFTIIASIISMGLSVYFLGLSKLEKEMIVQKLRVFIHRKRDY